jgi:hypothetical protein
MASNINDTGIDATYPLAGVDNDSQGFRDNFSIIKDNFTAAKAEIETLQNTSAKLSTNNDFQGNNIVNANLNNVTSNYYNGGTLIASQNVSYLNGDYHTYTAGGDVTLTLADWSDTGFGRIIVHLFSDGENRTVNFLTESGVLRLKSDMANPVTTGTNTNVQKIFEFWSFNGGASVYGRYLGEFA